MVVPPHTSVKGIFPLHWVFGASGTSAASRVDPGKGWPLSSPTWEDASLVCELETIYSQLCFSNEKESLSLGPVPVKRICACAFGAACSAARAGGLWRGVASPRASTPRLLGV